MQNNMQFWKNKKHLTINFSKFGGTVKLIVRISIRNLLTYRDASLSHLHQLKSIKFDNIYHHFAEQLFTFSSMIQFIFFNQTETSIMVKLDTLDFDLLEGNDLFILFVK